MTSKQQAALERLKSSKELAPGPRLRAIREALDLGEKALGELLLVRGPTIHAWEHEDKIPTGASPHLIEAWSRDAVRSLSLDESAVIEWTEWLSGKERDRLATLASPSPEPQAPSSAPEAP